MPSETLSFDIFANDRASATFRRLGLAASNASGDVRTLGDRLDKLGTKVSTARVKLDGNKEANAELDKLDVKLIRLGNKVASPNITVEGKIKALADIAAVDLAMDRLNEKFARPSIVGRLGAGLLGSLGGGAGGIGAAGIGVSTAALGALAIAAAQAGAALLAAGAGVAAFGALAYPQFTKISGALTQIHTDTLAYNRATTAASKSLALKHIRDDWAGLSGPQRQAVHGVQSLQSEFGKLSAKLAPITFKVFDEGLKVANKLLPILLPFAQAAGTAIDGLLKGLNKFVTPAAGAGLHGKLAAISGLPPPTGFQQFVSIMQGLTGPAITALGKGLGQIAIAVGNLIEAAASPNSVKVLSDVLGILAHVIDGLAWAINRASGNIQKWKDILHQTAGKFDEFRHDAARMFAAVATLFDQARHMVATWGHDVAHTFDTLRHSVAVTWNAMWAATIGAQIRSLAAIVGWFKGLPGRILGALSGLGHQLYAFGHAALSELWAGFKAVGGSILHWLGGFLSSLIGIAKKILGVFSPSAVFFDIGKNMMLGLEGGIKAHARSAVSAARNAAQAAAGAHGGPTSASAAQAQAYARSRLGAYGWSSGQMPALIALWMGESGWNRLARNPTSGAYGIPQALPASKMGAAANPPTSSAAAQINWGMGYIRSVYGDPANAYRLWLSRSPHWYGGGLQGGIFTRPTLIGVGERGPERVSVTPMVMPSRGSGEQRIVLEIHGGQSGFDGFMLNWIQKNARIRGGGNVQKAFGKP
jgi:hypothetical protein